MSLIFIVITGVRPDALFDARCSNMQALRKKGAATLTASSVMPSITLPCNMSIFHSVPPERHGIVTNDWVPMARPLPGLIEQARIAGLRCGFVYNWEPLRYLSQPERLAFSYFRDNATDPQGDQVLAEEAVRFITSDRPDFMFVSFGTVDTAGHNHGWMSARYLAQLERVDRALGTLLDALPIGYSVLVQSDHGGHDHTHGTDSPEDMTIPWMVTGPGIRRGYEIQAPINLLDTAPTIANLLGIPLDPRWEGRVVKEIFDLVHAM